MSCHTRGNIDRNRKIVLGNMSRHFVPADNDSLPRESPVELFSQRSKMILYTGRETKFNLFKTYYNYQ